MLNDSVDPTKTARQIRRKETNDAYYRANREKILARCAERHLEIRPERLAQRRAYYRNDNNLPTLILDRARRRAREKKLMFSIDVTDIDIPTHCPILGLPLLRNEGVNGKNSPSLDRIDSTKGYIKGNVQVISQLANRMKSNASPEEMLAFAKWVMAQPLRDQDEPLPADQQ